MIIVGAELTIFIETLILMFYPLDLSCYSLITDLTETMLDFVHAPVPYIIGCSSDIYKKLWSLREWENIKEEVMIVLLDKNDDGKIEWVN